MRDKDKKRDLDPVGYGGGKVKKKELEEMLKEFTMHEKQQEGKPPRTWKEKERY